MAEERHATPQSHCEELKLTPLAVSRYQVRGVDFVIKFVTWRNAQVGEPV
jgi:hypothetical protein